MTAKGYESAKPLIKAEIEVVLKAFGLSKGDFPALADALVTAVQRAQRQHNRDVFGQED